ncbi:Piwi domain-containing protein [Suillus plorans]|uniref:Piwi domain-containing protein n=1 Tax=Suillus plorans TaxID=116603 RepID=A0A9P7J6A1_9AGAM|nr:Piwi domain-containing protein [Suillus plorans]KAG1804734.1 Piwi domain-containing protein [Suillus plorans]
MASAPTVPLGQRRPMAVYANAFDVTQIPVKAYEQYDVGAVRWRHRIVERLQNHEAPRVFRLCLFDGKSILYSAAPLDLPDGTSGNYTLVVPGKGRVTVKVARVAGETVTFDDLKKFLTGKISDQTPKVSVALNLLQFIIRQAPNLKYPNNGRAYFTSGGSKDLRGGLQLFRGFFQSVRPAIGRVLVNVDISAAAMYKPGPFVDVALEVLNIRGNARALSFKKHSKEWNILSQFFRNLLVEIKLPKKTVTKKIVGLVEAAGRFPFTQESEDGSSLPTTVEEYYHKTYNIRLAFPDIIGIELSRGSGKNTVIPAELCTVAAGQRYNRKLPQNMTSMMVDFSKFRPEKRLEMIVGQKGDRVRPPTLEYATSPYIQDAGMEISEKPITIQGQLLKAPTIFYGKKQSAASVKAKPSYKRGNGVGSVDRDIKEACALALVSAGAPRGYNKPPEIVLVILPQSAADIRQDVKRAGDVTLGVSTQCVREDNIAKFSGRQLDQYCNNIAIKINARLTGVNSIPSSPAYDWLTKEDFMFFGADVGHPGAGVQNKPSVASVVFSYDRHGVKYSATSRVQQPRQERIGELGPMVYDAITRYGKVNGKAPRRLMFFRDGLSEGEYAGVGELEFQDIKEAVRRVWAEVKLNDPPPLITYLIVGKRHHVRFFPTNPQDGDRKSGNVQAGFVASEGIANPIAKDFYLLSHGGILGTSRPAHYIVLKDEIFNFDIRPIQEVAYTLCHAYVSATRSVSIPAPVYYADKVCARAEYHFDASLRYIDSDGATVASSSTCEKQSFNLSQWRSGYAQTHSSMLARMFFA